MKRTTRMIPTLAGPVFLLAAVTGIAGPPQLTHVKPESVTVGQARHTLTGNGTFVPDQSTPRWGTIDGSSFHFTSGSVRFDTVGSLTGPQHFKFDLKTLEAVSAECKPHRRILLCREERCGQERLLRFFSGTHLEPGQPQHSVPRLEHGDFSLRAGESLCGGAVCSFRHPFAGLRSRGRGRPWLRRGSGT